MSDRFELELNKVSIPIYVLEDGKYLVKKASGSGLNNLSIEKGRSYILKFIDTDVSRNLMKVTADNWNKSRQITSKYLHCDVAQVMGQMIQLNGVGYDFDLKIDLNDIYYNYWINRDCVEIIEILH